MVIIPEISLIFNDALFKESSTNMEIISDGGLGPYRLKVRTASFSNISILPNLLEGALLPDLIAIMGSLDFVLGDVDR